MRLFAAAFIVFAALVGRPSAQQVGLDPALERNKDLIERYFQLADTANVQSLRAIVNADYIEHAPYAADGIDALLARVTANAQSEGGVRRERSELVRMIAERDEVWTYSRVNAGGTLLARVDMFRIENNQVAEHWAVQEKVNLQRSNANDQWAVGKGPQDFTRQPKRIARRTSAQEIAVNKRTARLWFQYSEARDPNERKKLLEISMPDYIQHNANQPDGTAGRIALQPNPLPYHMNVRMLSEGNFVWSLNVPNFAAGHQNGVERVNHNQWRIEDGKLAEHWGTFESVPAQRANSNDFLGYGRTHVRDFSR